jgi:hypothetical protein
MSTHPRFDSPGLVFEPPTLGAFRSPFYTPTLRFLNATSPIPTHVDPPACMSTYPPPFRLTCPCFRTTHSWSLPKPILHPSAAIPSLQDIISILDVLDKHLIPSAASGESTVFYHDSQDVRQPLIYQNPVTDEF